MPISSDHESALTQELSLSDLAPEILTLVVFFLDSIDLISLSQCSQGLRWFTQPTRSDFIQRLLSLELLPEYNGSNRSVFRTELVPGGTMDPAMNDMQAWEGMRYACAQCLKLRSHLHFDNPSIMRLTLRKPPPGSLEATKLTDWKPFGFSHSRSKMRQQIQHGKEEAKKRYTLWRKEKYYYIQHYRESDTAELRDQRSLELEEAEKQFCGTKRHKRLCIECKYERSGACHGQIPSNIAWRGGVPMIESRRFYFYSSFDRHFPDLFADLIPTHEQRHGLDTPRPWTLHMVRCKACSEFKELASFRRRSSAHGSYPPLPTSDDDLASLQPDQDPDVCSPCYAEMFGPEALQHRLVSLALFFINTDKRIHVNFLERGWSTVAGGRLLQMAADRLPRSEWAHAEELFRRVQDRFGVRNRSCCLISSICCGPKRMQDAIPLSDLKPFEEHDIEALNALHQDLFQTFFSEVSKADWPIMRHEYTLGSYSIKPCSRQWFLEYEKAVRSYSNANEMIRRINETPGLLLDNAMLSAASSNR